MTDLTKLTEMLDWKLLKYSHEWPGPDGGTCINEAAIVAAGFEYRQVEDHASLPSCFCPVIGQALIWLNDYASNERRQQLIKYIPMLPGSYDDDGEVAVERAKLIGRAFGFRPFSKAPEYGLLPQKLTPHEVAEIMSESFNGAVILDSLICVENKVEKQFDQIIAAIEAAFEIGNKAEPMDIALAAERMAEAKAQGKAREEAVAE